MALIEELMKTDLISVGPEEKVRQVAERMARNGVGAVLVVDEDGLRGLFSERDLLQRVVVPGLDPDTTRVDSVMTVELETVEPATKVRDCAEQIRSRGVRHLPVVRDGRAVGILSTRDFQDHVVRGLESFIDEARYKESLEGGQDPYDHIGGSYAR